MNYFSVTTTALKNLGKDKVSVWAASLLFVLGKFVLGWYIGRSAYTSTYGAAGSLLVILGSAGFAGSRNNKSIYSACTY